MSTTFLTPSKQTPPPAQQVTLTSYGSLEQMFKVADYLSKSPIVPGTFQGEPGSVLIALNLASNLRLDPFMVMQNIYVVHGRPAMSGQFMIALLNKSEKYARIEYVKTNTGMKVVGHRHDGGQDEGTEITRKMIDSEGWSKNSKWQTMTEQMLRYRAAAFFARAYCPEELMGMSTVDEVEEVSMRDVTPEKEEKPVKTVEKPEFLENVADGELIHLEEVPSFGKEAYHD